MCRIPRKKKPMKWNAITKSDSPIALRTPEDIDLRQFIARIIADHIQVK